MKRSSKIAVSTIGVMGLSFAAMMCSPSSTYANGIDPNLANGYNTAVGTVGAIGQAVGPYDFGITSLVSNFMGRIGQMVADPSTIGTNISGLISDTMGTAQRLPGIQQLLQSLQLR